MKETQGWEVGRILEMNYKKPENSVERKDCLKQNYKFNNDNLHMIIADKPCRLR